jgi:hypothetical protein
MGDYLQKVLPGQAMRMPAETYNRLMDMLRAWMGDSLGGGAGSAFGRRDLVTIRIENASGYDLEQYDILGLTQADQGAGGVWPKPADNLDAFCEGAVFTGHVPDLTKHEGRFAVVLEPVANGQMCRAAIAGVVPVYVSVQDEADQWADINDGEYETLLSGKSGAAQLLFKEEGVGDKWCLARLGPPALPTVRGARVTSRIGTANEHFEDDDTFIDAPIWYVTAVECALDDDGTGPEGQALTLLCGLEGMNHHQSTGEIPTQIEGGQHPVKHRGALVNACYMNIKVGDVIAWMPCGDSGTLLGGTPIDGVVVPYLGTNGAVPQVLVDDSFYGIVLSENDPGPGYTVLEIVYNGGDYDFTPVRTVEAFEVNGVSGIPINSPVLVTNQKGRFSFTRRNVTSTTNGPSIEVNESRQGYDLALYLESADNSIDISGPTALGHDPGQWDFHIALTSEDGSVTITKGGSGGNAGHWDLSVAGGGGTYEAGNGIEFTVGATTTVISVRLSATPGLQFTGAGGNELAVLTKTDGGIAVDGNGLYVVVNTNEGLHVDGSGVGVSLVAEADSSLAFDTSGAVTHSLQPPMLGVGVPTGITGENLMWDGDGESAVFDPMGHYNPDTTNTLKHGPPGAVYLDTSLL